MNKSEIAQLLDQTHNSMLEYLANHEDSKWDKGPDGKWTTGQHIVHLIQSISALNKGLKIPGLVLQYKFGKANRGPREYMTIINRYNEKLKGVEKGVVSPLSKNMPSTPPDGKQEIINRFTEEKDKLLKMLNSKSEKALDKYLIPHPLMGRMLMREIIMWTAYHTEHHQKVLKEKY